MSLVTRNNVFSLVRASHAMEQRLTFRNLYVCGATPWLCQIFNRVHQKGHPFSGCPFCISLFNYKNESKNPSKLPDIESAIIKINRKSHQWRITQRRIFAISPMIPLFCNAFPNNALISESRNKIPTITAITMKSGSSSLPAVKLLDKKFHIPYISLILIINFIPIVVKTL